VTDLTANEAEPGALEAGRQVATQLERSLGDALVAVYLHGSAVLGGFRWDRSDLDVLAVSRRALNDAEVAAIGGGLPALTYPANGLEFSLMTAEEARLTAPPSPRFQIHVTTRARDRVTKVVDGRRRGADPDLLLHIVACRERGVALLGPPPKQVFPEVSHALVLAAMEREIDWAVSHGPPPEYTVLTACRTWRYASEGVIGSKVEAGEWTLIRLGAEPVVTAALKRQRGGEAELTRTAVLDFVERMHSRLRGLPS
jgi:streptomycin 3"-adenylyltransferase